MKKFSEEFAADFKQKKDTDSEVSDAEVRSKGEKEFKDKHKVDKKDHPTAGDVAHKAKNEKAKNETSGEKKPLKTYKEHSAKADDKLIGEITAEKIKEGWVTLEDGNEIEISEEVAEMWNDIIPDLHAENSYGLAATALADMSGYKEVLKFITAGASEEE